MNQSPTLERPPTTSRSIRRWIARIAGCLLICAVTGDAESSVFGLIDTGEIYASGNGGTSWSAVAALRVSDAVGLAAAVSTSDLYVMTRSGTVYHSTNAGVAWTPVGALSWSDVAAFTIDFDGSLLALTETGVLERSMDGGAAFHALGAISGSGFVSLLRGPLGRLEALSATGEVYESQDRGVTWAAVGKVTTSQAVCLGRKGAELYLLTQTGEVHRSIDYGRTWTPVGAMAASNMRWILEAGPGLLAAAETGEVYGSATGSTWTAIGSINQLRVRALGSDVPLATGVPESERAPRFVLHHPRPNPSSQRFGSTFSFEISEPGSVRIDLYDVRGRRVARWGPVLFASGGVHRIQWKPEGVPSGSYMARLSTAVGQFAVTKWNLVR